MAKGKYSLMENIDRYAFVILIFAYFVMATFTGIGIPFLIALAGIIFCMAGLIEGEVSTDLWMLIPMIAFTVICGISSFTTFGNFSEGYTGILAIYPVLYMVISYLDENQSRVLRKLCILWGEIIAVHGILVVIYESFATVVTRLGGVIGNPNALGIFLALIWLAVLRERKESEGNAETKSDKLIIFLEPFILIAITLTLSMGSFLALAAGVIIYMIIEKKVDFALMAEMSIYAGTGLLLYIAGRKTDYAVLVLLPAVYAVLLAVSCPDFRKFFQVHRGISAGITGAGVLGGITAVLLRPSATATFAERIEMMKNGLGYFMEHPLTGVGSYQWRILNYSDGGKYFNTWHIHNVLIHIAAELGIIAAVLLVILFVRAVTKKENRNAVPAIGAFIVHNLIDTSFFYLGNTSVLLFTNRTITGKEHRLGNVTARIFYGIYLIYFLYSLLYVTGIFK